jgi:hypothetical protein
MEECERHSVETLEVLPTPDDGLTLSRPYCDPVTEITEYPAVGKFRLETEFNSG